MGSWHTDKNSCKFFESKRLRTYSCFLYAECSCFFFGKEMCGVVSGKSLAYNTRTDSTPSCQGRSKSRYLNQPQKSQLLATHAMMMIAARIESVTKRTREIILRLFLTLKDCCLKDSASSL